MDRTDLLLTIGKAATTLRIFREAILERAPEREAISEDTALRRAVRDLIYQANVLFLPGGTPCSRCNGSGVEPSP